MTLIDWHATQLKSTNLSDILHIWQQHKTVLLFPFFYTTYLDQTSNLPINESYTSVLQALTNHLLPSFLNVQKFIDVHAYFTNHEIHSLDALTMHLNALNINLDSLTATSDPVLFLIANASLALSQARTCAQIHNQSQTIADLGITMTMLKCAFKVDDMNTCIPANLPHISTVLFVLDILTNPNDLPNILDWMLRCYRQNRSIVRSVIYTGTVHLSHMAPSAARRIMALLKSGAVLPSLILYLTIKVSPEQLLVPVFDAIFSSNPVAVSRDLNDRLELLPCGMPVHEPKPVASLLSSYMLDRVHMHLSKKVNIGLAQLTNHIRLLALLNGAVLGTISLTQVLPLVSMLTDKYPVPLTECFVCLLFTILTSLPSTHILEAGVLVQWTLKFPPLAVLILHAGPLRSWASMQTIWSRWLLTPDALIANPGQSVLCMDRLRLDGDWNVAEAIVKAALKLTSPAILVLNLVRDTKDFHAHLALDYDAVGHWLFNHMIRIQDLNEITLPVIELVEQFVDGATQVPTPVFQLIDPSAVQVYIQEHATNNDSVSPSLAVLAYYVLLLSTKTVTSMAHRTQYNVLFIHAIPITQILSLVRSTPLYYKISGTVPTAYLALMQALKCMGITYNTVTKYTRHQVSIEMFLNARNLSEWVIEFAKSPMEVSVQTAQWLLGTTTHHHPITYLNLIQTPTLLVQRPFIYTHKKVMQMVLVVLEFVMHVKTSFELEAHVNQAISNDNGGIPKRTYAEIESVVLDDICFVNSQVIRILVENVTETTKETVFAFVNRMFMKNAYLPIKFTTLGFDPRIVPEVAEIPAFHVFLSRYQSAFELHPHLTCYLLASLMYQYPLPDLLTMATKFLIPTINRLIHSSLDSISDYLNPMVVIDPDANGQYQSKSVVQIAGVALNRYDVILRAVAVLMRAFPELLPGLQQIMFDIRDVLKTRMLKGQSDQEIRIGLNQCYDSLMLTIEEVMTVSRTQVMHCAR